MDRSPARAPAQRNLDLVDRYFELLQKGDPRIAELFTPDACWLAPQSAPVGRRHEGLDAVLALMASGLGLYDTTRPMQIERTASLAGDERVYIEMTIRATTRRGEPYENHYVMAFELRDGRIAEVREYVDSLYAQRKLFDPAGMVSPLDRDDRGNVQ
jgi:ketosteroid isomerase-like protein